MCGAALVEFEEGLQQRFAMRMAADVVLVHEGADEFGRVSALLRRRKIRAVFAAVNAVSRGGFGMVGELVKAV